MGVTYRVELSMIPNEVLKSIIEDGLGMQWKSNAPFTAVSDDHATEWVNGLSKSAAGLKSIIQIDSATLK